MGLVAAIAGTTCSAAVFIMRSTVVAEKGWGIKNLKEEKKDAFVSAAMMLFLSGVIMAVAAGTLHVMGFKLDNTVEMILLFEPIGGNAAAFILILGIVGAGLVHHFSHCADCTLADCRLHRQTTEYSFYPIADTHFVAMLFAFGTVFLEQRPPALMVFSQAFQAVILPAVAIPILLLINRAKLMGINKASLRENIGIWAVVHFFVCNYVFCNY
jgi:manganese transport protein